MHQRLSAYAFLIPALLVVGLLVVGLGYLADSSLRVLDRSTFTQADSYSLDNFAAVFERPVYWRIIGRTLLASVVVTALTLALAFPYAYCMVRTSRAGLRKLLLIGLFLPFFIGQVVRAYGWLIVLGQQGLVNGLLGTVGLEPVRIIFTFPGVLVGLVQYMLPFAVLLLAPAVTAIAEEFEQASESLGAAWPATLWHVVLPMAKPGLVAAGVVVFALTITDYAMPEIMGGGTLDFVASAIYDGFFSLSDWGLGSALGILLVVLASALVTAAFAAIGIGTLGFAHREDG